MKTLRDLMQFSEQQRAEQQRVVQLNQQPLNQQQLNQQQELLIKQQQLLLKQQQPKQQAKQQAKYHSKQEKQGEQEEEEEEEKYFEVLEATEKRDGHIWFSYHREDQDLVDKLKNTQYNLENYSSEYWIGDSGLTKRKVEKRMNQHHTFTQHIYGGNKEKRKVEREHLESLLSCKKCQSRYQWCEGITIYCTCGDHPVLEKFQCIKCKKIVRALDLISISDDDDLLMCNYCNDDENMICVECNPTVCVNCNKYICDICMNKHFKKCQKKKKKKINC